MYKIDNNLKFDPKRNFKLITPCCNKSNLDGKFVNYIGFNDIYGYCHSCGKASLPPTIFKNEEGIEFLWNDNLKIFEPLEFNPMLLKNKSSGIYTGYSCNINNIPKEINLSYIPNELVKKYLKVVPENNLLKYIRLNYGNENADKLKNQYLIGTSKDGGTIFWNININQKVQKAKVSYYDLNGRRTPKFKSPFTNENGYYSCLFGEHLLANNNKTVILVESEKTAVICSLFLPDYTWLAYGGSNGLSERKATVLIDFKVLIIPDISSNAVAIINKKLPHIINLGIDAQIWDMTEGKSDIQLKEEGLYNCDLEDLIRNFQTAI